MKDIAVLITGELRFKDENHFNNFLNTIGNYDVYISTYPIYEKLAKKLTDKFIIASTVLPIPTMYQWFHLDNIIKKWKKLLLEYTKIIKIRTDIIYNNFNLFNLDVCDNTIYAQTDQIFYGNSYHFINCYEDMFENVLNLYYKKSLNDYIEVNYFNILNSDSDTDVRIEWLNVPKCIYSTNFKQFQENIKKIGIDYLQNNINNLEIEFGQKTNLLFTSERCFLIQTINKGIVKKSKIIGILMNNRKQFSYE